ncbi:MAG: HDIG domain-containing protein [Desulfovibrio sp.]|nr:HDIG domain-containing protein [Desulfovibrio sp.]
MIEREEALGLLAGHGVKAGLLQHSLASEAVLKGLAERFGEDQELWGLAGLLHDIDYPATVSCPERHGLEGAALLEGRLPEAALHAIRAHNGEMNGTAVETLFDRALRCGETVTGLVTAAALVRPTGIEGMEVKSLKKKLKDKAFAAGVNRDVVKSCTEMGLSLEEFLGLAIASMAKDARALGLLKEPA